MSRDIIHKWEPSERLRRLAERVGAPVVEPQSQQGILATVWLRENAGLFSSKSRATAVAHIVRYHMPDITIDELRERIAGSWIEDGCVQGSLRGIRNLGVITFEEMRRVVR